ncbi:unnamed protein product, partial [Adineta steineri]
IKQNNNQYEIEVEKILYLSNLNKQITKNHLRYFILKQSRLPTYCNYVIIFHRINLRAEYNRKRAIDSLRFGSDY